MRDYKEAISAKNENWRSEARDLMKSGVEFVIVHLTPEDYRDCGALAKEFDYSECLEDDSRIPQGRPENNHLRSPTRIGFVKRGLPKLRPR